tara:strand:- start:56 stop:730 length:675 start_codon:yes stop_codon:yes gene_type:complete
MKKKLRNEKKFVLNNLKLNNFLSWLNVKTLMRKKFLNRTVNSLYIDDLENNSVKDNLIGIAYRSKRRFRWYSENNIFSDVVFEEKIKEGKLGYKNKLKLHHPIDADTQIQKLVDRYISELEEKKYILKKYYVPTLYISYERSYYEDANGARVTIDRNIYFSQVKHFSKLKNLKKYSYNNIIAEVKYSEDNTDFIDNSLKYLQLLPQRHSKYLTGMAVLGDVKYL